MHSYKDEVTAQHDAFCIGNALQSALENRRDSEKYDGTIEEVLEEAYGYIAEGLSICKCMFSGLTGEARISHLAQFSDSALQAMTQGGYINEFTDELMKITLEDYAEVERYRDEKNNDWEATNLADEIVGEQNPVVSDTVSIPRYSLVVDGKKSEFGTYVTKWGICYAIVREFQRLGINPEFNTGAIATVLETIGAPSDIILACSSFTVVFEENN